jgi:predicted dehydrogenase
MTKTLKFGIIGLGHFGKHYARLLQEISGVQLVKTSNTSGETDEIINNKEINCVVIATPSSTHCELIIKSLRAGKHVLVEKPMVLSVAEVKKVEKELKKHKDLVFMVGFQYVYNDSIQYIKNHINELGAVKYFFGENLYCGPVRVDVGSFVDAGIHDLAIVQYLFAPGKVVKISGASRSFGNSANDDFSAVTVKFKSGLMVHLLTSRYWPEKVRKVTLVGDKAMALFNDRDENKLKWIKNTYPTLDNEHSSLFLPDVNNQLLVMPASKNEPLKNELEHFIKCVNTNSQPLTGLEFGCQVTKMMEEINRHIVKL